MRTVLLKYKYVVLYIFLFNFTLSYTIHNYIRDVLALHA